MASIQYVVNATDMASTVFAKIAASADGLDKQLADLGKRVADPEVALNDTKFTLGMINAAKRLDKLSAMMATPGANLEDGKFQTEIIKINAQLDRLDKRRVTAEVNIKADRSLLSRVGGFFGIGGGGAGITGTAGDAAPVAAAANTSSTGFLGSLGQYGTPAAYGGLGILAALLAPALIPAAVGLGVGGAGILGGVMVGAKDRAKLVALQKSLAGVIGTTPSSQARRSLLQGQIGAFQQSHGPQLAFGQLAAGVGHTAESTFFGALTAQPVTLGAGGPQRGQSFLQGLIPVFEQVERFVKRLQPELTDLFRASLPYLGMFVKFLERTASVLLPVFTQMLVQMTPYLPLIGKGLLEIVKGFAGFLQAIGPSAMQASAKIFVALTIGMAWALKGLGIAINWLVENVPVWVHDIAKWWDWQWHTLVSTFTSQRHDIAHIWDLIFENSIGTVIRLVHNVETQFNSMRHETAVIFDGARHDIAHVWDLIYQNTIGAVIRFGHDVEARYDAIRAGIFSIMDHLPGQLWNLAKDAIENIIKGAQSVVPHITSFFSGFAKGIVDIFHHIWGWFSPSAVMYQGGKSLMTGLEAGIKDHAHLAVQAASAAAHRVSSAGSGVQRWAGLVREALRMEGLSPSLLGNVLYQMSTESGGNPNAINLNDINAQMGDPSRGLMQTIMSTFQAYHWPGTSNNIYDPLANIAAALNYARHVYGPSLMSNGMGIGSGHGYAAGSWSVPYTGPALVHQGEMIIPAGAAAAVRSGAGGNTYNVTVVVGHGTHPVQAAQEIAKLLNAGAKSGVKLRTSILGPG